MLIRPGIDISVEMPVEKVLIDGDQERAGPAGGIENSKLACRATRARRLALEKFPDSVFDDIIDDVRRCVIDAARLFYLGFVFDHCAVTGCQADDLAQKLFVHLPKDVGRQHREFVGAIRIIQALDDVL